LLRCRFDLCARSFAHNQHQAIRSPKRYKALAHAKPNLRRATEIDKEGLLDLAHTLIRQLIARRSAPRRTRRTLRWETG
jgi:hypothetical protein